MVAAMRIPSAALSSAALIQLGHCYRQQGRVQDAIDAYQKAAFQGHQTAELWVILGDLFYEQRRWPDAELSYRSALLLAADDADTHYKLGRAIAHSGHTASAIEFYQRAVAINPHLAEAYVHMGNAFALEHDLEQAISCYTQVILQDSDHPQIYQNLAAVFTQQSNLSGLAYCQRQLAKRQRDWPRSPLVEPESRTVKNDASSQSGELSRSRPQSLSRSSGQPFDIEEHYRSIAASPEDASAYAQLAQAQFQVHNFESAIAFYKIALRLKPSDFFIAVQLQKSIDALHKAQASRKQPAPQPLQQPLQKSVSLPTSRKKLIPFQGSLPPLVGKGNDYTFITQKVEQFIRSRQPYHRPVSIIIPTYNRKDKLAKALAALTHQSYPQHLIEVIVADDGSTDGIATVLQKFQSHLTLKHVWQPDLGFRLAGVCNLGIANASHDCLILLQCDMIPQPQLVEAYMAYFHIDANALLIGGRLFVCSDGVTDDKILADVNTALKLPTIRTNNETWTGQKSWQDWRIAVYEKTDRLKKEPYPFRTAVGSNLAFSKQLVEEIGDFCEDFHAWGGEDREFGYRAYNAGYYLIPVRDALGLHQEPPGGVNESDRTLGSHLAKAICEEKCPLPTDRKYRSGRTYDVPKVSINLVVYPEGGDSQTSLTLLRQSIESILAQTYTDLEVRVFICATADDSWHQLQTIYSKGVRVQWQMLEKGLTLPQVLNSALRLSNGPYIGWLKPGHLLAPMLIEKLNTHLDTHSEVGCVFAGDAAARDVEDVGRRRKAVLKAAVAQPFRLIRKRDWMRTAGFPEDLRGGLSSGLQSSTRFLETEMLLRLSAVCSFDRCAI